MNKIVSHTSNLKDREKRGFPATQKQSYQWLRTISHAPVADKGFKPHAHSGFQGPKPRKRSNNPNLGGFAYGE